MVDLEALRHHKALVREEYKIITLTPLLMHGWQKRRKDGRNSPEFAEVRPLSIKGVIRYWWRTVQFDVKDAKELYRKEVERFGGAWDEETSQKSSLLLQIDNEIKNWDAESLFPHRTDRKVSAFYIKENQTFSLHLATLIGKREKLAEYKKWMEWSVLVGGFGQRSRRGFGAFHLVGKSPQSIPDFLDKIVSYLPTDVVQKGDNYLSIKNADDRWPMLRYVIIGKKEYSAKEILKKINQASHEVTKKYGDRIGSVKPRFPSPLHASVRKIGDDYYPLIVILSDKQERESDYWKAMNLFVLKVGGEEWNGFFS